MAGIEGDTYDAYLRNIKSLTTRLPFIDRVANKLALLQNRFIATRDGLNEPSRTVSNLESDLPPNYAEFALSPQQTLDLALSLGCLVALADTHYSEVSILPETNRDSATGVRVKRIQNVGPLPSCLQQIFFTSETADDITDITALITHPSVGSMRFSAICEVLDRYTQQQETVFVSLTPVPDGGRRITASRSYRDQPVFENDQARFQHVQGCFGLVIGSISQPQIR